MKQKGIKVKAADMSVLAEESGFAYKNLSEVVWSVKNAGISHPVATFKPIGNIKG
jgi:RNA-splicing ligase RtcB